MKGKIQKLFADKGYGFIRADSGRDYFFYYSAIGKVEFQKLAVNQDVVFDIGRADKGEERATAIKIVNSQVNGG